MNIKSVFLHAGMRTGGTALALAFRKTPNFKLFYDPFSEELERISTLLTRSTMDWSSGHPKNNYYFTEYKDHILNGSIFGFKSTFRYDYFGKQSSKSSLFEYLNQFIKASQNDGQIPVFKFETSEGRIEQLKLMFANSFHIGVIREIDKQELSFLKQLLRGNPSFYVMLQKLAESYVNEYSPSDLRENQKMDPENLNWLFQTYVETRSESLKSADVLIDMTSQVSANKSMSGLDKFFDASVLNQLKQNLINFDSLSETHDFLDVAKIVLKKVTFAEQARAEAEQARAEAEQARAEAEQARAEAEQARAEAEQARAKLLSIETSRIWRISTPYRRLMMLKKNMR